MIRGMSIVRPFVLLVPKLSAAARKEVEIEKAERQRRRWSRDNRRIDTILQFP